MLWDGLPFIRIFEDDVPSIEDIQFRHLVLKPKAVNTSNKYCHPTESKAFEMSSLMSRAGSFSWGSLSEHRESYHEYTFF